MRLPWQMSDLHPHALSLDDTALSPDFADALAEDLALLSPPDVIHRFRIVLPQGHEQELLSRHGFRATRLTRLIRLPLDAITTPPPPHTAAHWFKAGERAPWGAWLTAHWHHYVTCHSSNPPQRPKDGLSEVFLGHDLIEGLALRQGPQGRVLSFASLRENEELGWIGGDPELLPATLAACLRRATAHGWSHALLEVDDDDRALWALAQRLAPEGGQTYVTWQRERAGSPRPI